MASFFVWNYTCTNVDILPYRVVVVKGRQRIQLLHGGCNCSAQCYRKLQLKLLLVFFHRGLFVLLKPLKGYNQAMKLAEVRLGGSLLCVKYQFSKCVAKTLLRNQVMLRCGLPFHHCHYHWRHKGNSR